VTDLAQMLVLGASLGAIYALMAASVTVVYQASRVPNVAFVGIGTAAAVLHGDLVTSGGRFGTVVGWWPALAIALAFAAVLGLVTDLLVRSLRGRAVPSLFLLLGWTAALLAAADALWEPRVLPPVWAGPPLAVGNFSVLRVQVANLALAGLCGLGLVALYHRTRLGLALRASAADAEAARMMGMDLEDLSRRAWVVSSVLAAVATILVVFPVFSNTYETTVYLAFAFGAALVGGFRSLPLAAAGGLALGILPALLEPTDTAVRIGGVGNLVAFVLIAGLLLKRPAVLTRRAEAGGPRAAAQNLAGPSWPAPRPSARPLPPWARRAGFLGLGAALGVVVPLVSSDATLDAWASGLSVFLVCASIVIVSGWSGEIPLGQVAFAGFGAYMAGNLAVRFGLPHVAAVPLAAISVLPFVLLLGVPAFRGRGRLPFAVLSLVSLVVASSLLWGPRAEWFTGGSTVQRPDWMEVLWGRPAASFYLLALALAAGVVWFAVNVAHSRVGRAFVAVRDCEAGARSLGIDAGHYRMVALGFSAVVAALGGVVHAYLAGPIDPARFAAFLSVQYLLYTVVGGAGSLAGAAVVVFAFEVLPAIGGTGPGPGPVILLGLLAVAVVRFAPGGLAGLAHRVAATITPAGAPNPAAVTAGHGHGGYGVSPEMSGFYGFGRPLTEQFPSGDTPYQSSPGDTPYQSPPGDTPYQSPAGDTPYQSPPGDTPYPGDHPGEDVDFDG
jgi:branched-chain amino acid transport system permease protein